MGSKKRTRWASPELATAAEWIGRQAELLPPAAPGRPPDPALDALIDECLEALTAPGAETRAAAVALVVDHSGRPGGGAAVAARVCERLLAAALDGPAHARDAALDSLAALGPLPAPAALAEASRVALAATRADVLGAAPPAGLLAPDRLGRLAGVLRGVIDRAAPADVVTLQLALAAVNRLLPGWPFRDGPGTGG